MVHNIMKTKVSLKCNKCGKVFETEYELLSHAIMNTCKGYTMKSDDVPRGTLTKDTE
jgi:hypothetical protein